MGIKSVVITGATSGLGLETAKVLAGQPGWQVVVACRNASGSGPAIDAIRAVAKNPVIVVELDLASLKSVEAFGAAFDASGAAPLGALIDNAGLQDVGGIQRTVDGLERTYGVNHVAHFALTERLLPKMVEGGRIVVVSSGTHDPAQKSGMPYPEYRDLSELVAGASGTRGDMREGQIRYTTSKLLNVYFARELARRCERSGDARVRSIRVASIDPGLMPATGLARDYSPVLRWVSKHLLPLLRFFIPNVNTVEVSAARLAALVTEPSPSWSSGAYFSMGKPISPSVEALDDSRAAALWSQTEDLIRSKLKAV